MRVRYDDVGQLLDISETMRKTGGRNISIPASPLGIRLQNLPGGKLRPHVICGANQSRLRQGPTKKGQLPKTDRPNLAFNPSTQRDWVST